MIRSEYIFIHNCFELGKFNTQYGRSTSTLIMHPVLKKVAIENSKNYELIPGFLDRKENFYKCPLEIHHLKIDKYSIVYELTDERTIKEMITLHFEIFDLDYKNSIEEKITIGEHTQYDIKYQRFNTIINYLNLYVKSGRKIEDLNFSIFDKFELRSVFLERIIDFTNNLEMKIFEDSINRVGRDNLFWEDLEIRNIPKNLYFKQLIKKCFEKQGKRCEVTDYGLSIQLHKEFAYSASFSRRELKNYDTTNIRDRLKVLLAAEFDTVEFILSAMEKNSTL